MNDQINGLQGSYMTLFVVDYALIASVMYNAGVKDMIFSISLINLQKLETIQI